MEIKSNSFKENCYIPSKYTCQGDDINPSLIIRDIPKNTKSLAIIVDDPDAPQKTFVHWIIWNIKPQKEIKESFFSANTSSGINDFGVNKYKGPCPPNGVHRYFFKVYALNKMLDLNQETNKKDLEDAMQNHIIQKAQIMGIYKKE
ncbi:MAG: YbhB/YbcL family Raf kinase inhibitor-like protein [Nanoarchaeota archaeon]